MFALQSKAPKAPRAKSAPYAAAKPAPKAPHAIACRPGADFTPLLSRGAVQPKLAIGSAHDPLEHEADRAAERVLRMPDPAASARAAAGVASTGTNPLSSPGHPLDRAVAGYMGPRFGHDFSQVRVHADSEAAKAAEALNARAFAYGRHIVFGRNEYSPAATEGRRMIAHELAHVVQQDQAGRNRSGQGPGRIMRQERSAAPGIEPGEPARSWFYSDDPMGHVASIYFDTASSDFDTEDQGVLADVQRLLAAPQPPAEVTVVGSSDSVGDPGSNQQLSEHRAEAVATWLFPRPSPRTTVRVAGQGEQGPEPTAGNSHELSHYRRVDVIIRPPKPTAPIEPDKGSGAQYGSPELKRAMQLATGALDTTLAALRAPTQDTNAALERYFPGGNYRSADFIRTLTGEIQHIRDRMDSIKYLEVSREDILPDPRNPGHCPTDEYQSREFAWDPQLCRAIWNAAGQGDNPAYAAFSFPEDKPEQIVLMPRWRRNVAETAASILVHEVTHALLGLRGHPTEVPHRNPLAIQGFVARLGGLKAERSDEVYPGR